MTEGSSWLSLCDNAHGWHQCPCFKEQLSLSFENVVDDVVPKEKELTLSKNRRGFCVVQYMYCFSLDRMICWWFDGHLKEDKAIYTSIQIMHQDFFFFF